MSLEMRPLVGSARRERTTGFFARAWQDWGSFTRGCNWRDFTLLNVSGEWNHMTERVEVQIAAIGLHVEVTYAWGDTFYRGLNETRDRIESGEEPTYSLDEVLRRAASPSQEQQDR